MPAVRAWARAARGSPSCGWMVMDRPSSAVVHCSRSGHAAHAAPKVTAHCWSKKMSGRASHGALLLINGEVIKGEPAVHGRAYRPGLDDGVVPGVPVGTRASPLP